MITPPKQPSVASYCATRTTNTPSTAQYHPEKQALLAPLLTELGLTQ